MNSSKTTPAKAFTGHVKNGVIILDSQITLPEGLAVRVEALTPALLQDERAARVRELQQLFAQWTDEDGQLTDEKADCLHGALAKGRGLGFRSPALD